MHDWEEEGIEDCGFINWGGVGAVEAGLQVSLAHTETPAVFGILCAVRVKVLRSANPRQGRTAAPMEHSQKRNSPPGLGQPGLLTGQRKR